MAGLIQGIFKPQNPEKYKGNVHDIIYRSSWELKFMMQVDRDPNVIKWSSEEMIIWYMSPIDNRKHRYFVDFVVDTKDGKRTLVEIKPAHQTKAPVSTPKKRQKTYLKEVTTYVVNQAKWKAAEALCNAKGWKFAVLTEKELGIKYQKLK
ncbi:head completion protein [Rhizobium phage RHph_I1_18]|nr:head completion protein [Rhizobium phage RHph_I1_18]